MCTHTVHATQRNSEQRHWNRTCMCICVKRTNVSPAPDVFCAGRSAHRTLALGAFAHEACRVVIRELQLAPAHTDSTRRIKRSTPNMIHKHDATNCAHDATEPAG